MNYKLSKNLFHYFQHEAHKALLVTTFDELLAQAVYREKMALDKEHTRSLMQRVLPDIKIKGVASKFAKAVVKKSIVKFISSKIVASATEAAVSHMNESECSHSLLNSAYGGSNQEDVAAAYYSAPSSAIVDDATAFADYVQPTYAWLFN